MAWKTPGRLATSSTIWTLAGTGAYRGGCGSADASMHAFRSKPCWAKNSAPVRARRSG
jgi:hypothetical protein